MLQKLKGNDNAKYGSISALGMLVAIGIVYGDIGTSPLYVMRSVIEGNGGAGSISSELVIGAISLIIWTLTLLTTVKYATIAMSADNHGEGGIFSLYSILRRFGKWLVIPAMIGGAALLADGVLTPAVTVTSAVEGLRSIDSFANFLGSGSSRIVFIAVSIISLLFLMQQIGTSSIGKAFGSVMIVWFGFLGITGFVNMTGNLEVLKAFNPWYGVQILFSPYNLVGIQILGAVFLAATGAEALYSDMGHVGKHNIRGSWPFIKVCLILNYLGQGAWLINGIGTSQLTSAHELNPFFEMLPEEMRIFAVVLAALAAIIASQALITGSFTLVSEAISLDLLPHLKIVYPSQTKKQMYIPLVNNVLWISCVAVVIGFQTSVRMEAAYGLAITITMLMTTTLLSVYLKRVRKTVSPIRWLFVLFFGALELVFFGSSLTKFLHGGYVTVIIAAFLLLLMWIWHKGTSIENKQKQNCKIRKYIPMIEELHNDQELGLFADNLIYINRQKYDGTIDRDILFSILNKQPKRAKAYWFISVKVVDAPYTRAYRVENFGTDFIFRVEIQLGYKVSQRIQPYISQIITELSHSGELPPQDHVYSIFGPSTIGFSRYIFLRKQIVAESTIGAVDWMIMRLKYGIRRIAGSPMRWFGLEDALVNYEYVPLFTKKKKVKKLVRVG